MARPRLLCPRLPATATEPRPLAAQPVRLASLTIHVVDFHFANIPIDGCASHFKVARLPLMQARF